MRPPNPTHLFLLGLILFAGLTGCISQQTIRYPSELNELGSLTETEPVDTDLPNEKVYYVIVDSPDGEDVDVTRQPCTSNDTVLDAIGSVQGLTRIADKKMWVLLADSEETSRQIILPIDWNGIASGTATDTNYQLYSGDRVYVVEGKNKVSRALRAFLDSLKAPFQPSLVGPNPLIGEATKNLQLTGYRRTEY